jgi:hypothetical protein
MFHHLTRKFSDSNILEDQLLVDKESSLWKGQLGCKMCILKKILHFEMESFRLCEVKTEYIWNVLWYTGKDTELKNDVPSINILHYSKPSTQKLLKQGYITGLDNYYSSLKLFFRLYEL